VDPNIQNTSAIATKPRRGRGRASTLGVAILAVVVTLLAVFVILNYDRWVSVDFLVFDQRLRLIWALLIPLVLGLLVGFAYGRAGRR
jgi:uncharacterized integral membrane protein